MRRWLRDNGLSLFFGAIFLLALLGQSVAGLADYNNRLLAAGGDPVSYGRYVTSSAFAVDVAENWQSEYLQFLLMVSATVWLVQRGSTESKPVDEVGRGVASASSGSAGTPATTHRGGRGPAAGGRRSTPARSAW